MDSAQLGVVVTSERRPTQHIRVRRKCRIKLPTRRGRPPTRSLVQGAKFRVTDESRPDSLYIMVNPRIPGEIKIGRSCDPEERAKQLSNQQNFRLVVKHSYKDKGFLEKIIHQKLKHCQVEEGAGVEWFRVSVEEANSLIIATIFEDNLVNEEKAIASRAHFAQLLRNEIIWRLQNPELSRIPVPKNLYLDESFGELAHSFNRAL